MLWIILVFKYYNTYYILNILSFYKLYAFCRFFYNQILHNCKNILLLYVQSINIFMNHFWKIKKKKKKHKIDIQNIRTIYLVISYWSLMSEAILSLSHSCFILYLILSNPNLNYNLINKLQSIFLYINFFLSLILISNFSKMIHKYINIMNHSESIMNIILYKWDK